MFVVDVSKQDTVPVAIQRALERGRYDAELLLQGGRDQLQAALLKAERWAEDSNADSSEVTRRAAYATGLAEILARPVATLDS